MQLPPVRLEAPAWMTDHLDKSRDPLPDVEARMALAIDLARRNVENGTGGPFGAAIFETGTAILVSAGVNIVVPSRCSSAHAEVMAISTAQAVVGTHDLARGDYELVTSAEPCAMCFGAILWSGTRGLVCGARGEDISRAGFDEGPKPGAWTRELEQRGVTVKVDVLRAAAAEVLRDYASGGGPIYNSRR